MGTQMADPWFSRRGWGSNPRAWDKNLLFDNIFAKDCMKMNEIGRGRGGAGVDGGAGP